MAAAGIAALVGNDGWAGRTKFDSGACRRTLDEVGGLLRIVATVSKAAVRRLLHWCEIRGISHMRLPLNICSISLASAQGFLAGSTSDFTVGFAVGFATRAVTGYATANLIVVVPLYLSLWFGSTTTCFIS